MGSRWTNENIEFLKEKYANGKVSEIATTLGKTVGAVYNMRAKLGLDKEVNIFDASWTVAQECTLKELFPKHDNEEIAKQLNRSESAIRNRAAILKLKKADNYWKIGEEKYIMENYGKIPIEELMTRLGRTKWAIINKYRELAGLRKTGDKVVISKIKEK